MQQAKFADIVGIRAAAKELGTAPSTICRDVQSGRVPNRGTLDQPMVSIAEARECRAAPRRSAVQRIAARFRHALLRRWQVLAPELVGLSAFEIEEKMRAENETLLAIVVSELEI